MNMIENMVRDYKSIRKIRGNSADFPDLAKSCVCLANAQGGELVIGIEDNNKLPPAAQQITDHEINAVVTRLRTLCFDVSLTASPVIKHPNGGQYFSIQVFPSLKSIATTSDGKIYIRIGDQCHAARNEDIHRIANEREAFHWELVTFKDITLKNIDPLTLRKFADEIRHSVKVKPHIKQMSDVELAEHYNLSNNNCLTNLGLLWLGSAKQRGRIAYPITAQYIVYDDHENKVRKEDWHDYTQNPKELLLDIEQKAVELTYFYEFPQGLFRKQIRHYAPEVVRELLINAFAHKSYTISGDIFIEAFPDRLQITNPGGLPLGITKDNILHSTHRRNPHLIRIFHDLGLMEGEGSGYDLIYEKNCRDLKPFPEIISDYNSTRVIQTSKILDEDVVLLIDFIAQHYTLSQKEFIVLGVVARFKKILSTQLSKILQLTDEERLRPYVSRLQEQGILVTRGYKKGTEYLINPSLIASSKINVKPSLKLIEPHRLKALIEEDLKLNPDSSITNIQKRLVDVPIEDVRKMVYKLVKEGILNKTGNSKQTTVYYLAKKK